MSPSLVILANNHILDQGYQGLESTLESLERCDIPYVGVGSTPDNARKPYVLEKDGTRIGVYACAENEFSIVTENDPGANPFDPIESFDDIQRLKDSCDYVIVLYHGGKEHYRYPSPYLQKICRKMVQEGADLVLCQHSHCVGCYEQYGQATIVYGQGNFIFKRENSEFWRTGLLVKVCMDNEISVDYVPIVQEGKGVRMASTVEANRVMEEFSRRSEKIKEPGFVASEYQKLAASTFPGYVRAFAGFPRWLSRMDRYLLRSLLARRWYNNRQFTNRSKLHRM